MTTKGKGAAGSNAYENRNCYEQSSTGILPPQQRVTATEEFRADVLDYVRSLPYIACANDHFDFRHDGPNSVLSCGFQRLDASEAVELEITLHDWHPLSSIPVLDLCSELSDLGFSAENALGSARLSTRHGRTILTSAHPRELLQDLRELKNAASKLFDRVESQSNWLPIPDGITVSVQWVPVAPDGGFDE